VGNKNDLYQYEEVSNEDGKELAKKINAIYQRTSAKEEEGGVDELFKIIGKKILDPSYEIATNLTKEERRKRGEKLMREQIKNEKKQGGCC
jgi:GTPase SAR1 family protein